MAEWTPQQTPIYIDGADDSATPERLVGERAIGKPVLRVPNGGFPNGSRDRCRGFGCRFHGAGGFHPVASVRGNVRC
ncbi:MAG: hypothetical protein CMJ48_06130 [Planctomycetaceae bacterium]|nr:hypothetical protein [Planctomycetaceae bacterium]